MGTQHESVSHNKMDTKGFLAGLLLGGVAGASTMLLLAPQSGKRIRAHLQEKGIDLRDHTVKTMEDKVSQVRTKANQITHTIHKQAEDFQHRGQNLIDEQKERWMPVEIANN